MTAFSFFRDSINNYTKLTDEQFFKLLSFINPMLLKKGEFFVQKGIVSEHVAFVNKGILRLFYSKDNKEFVGDFFTKGRWIGEYGSLLSNVPAKYSIQAVVNTELFLLHKEDLGKLHQIHQCFERLSRMVAETLIVKLINSKSSLVLDSAEDRYLNFLNDKAELLKYVPLKQIAAYLGMEPETLSRIRRKLSRQSK